MTMPAASSRASSRALQQHRYVALQRGSACDKSTDGRTDGLTTEASSRGSKNYSYVTRGRAERDSP